MSSAISDPRLRYALLVALMTIIIVVRINRAYYGRMQDYRYLAYGGDLSGLTVFLLLLSLLFRSLGVMFLLQMFMILIASLIYYYALYLAGPYLRERISPEASSFLWVIPSIAVIWSGLSFRNQPLFWIRIGSSVPIYVIAAYLAVSMVLFIVKVVRHLIAMRRLLKGALPVEDTHVLAIWNLMMSDQGLKVKNVELAVSDAVKSPVAVGLFRKNMKVLLPHLDYSDEELQLIFRHELIHIAKHDSWIKLDMALISSLFWFIPAVWKSAESCAEDMELACDHLVLIDSSEEKKQQYAELILSTPSEAEGFTTCLSATAESLRYRLKNILEPKHKKSGAALVGVVFLVFIVLINMVGISFSKGSAGEMALSRIREMPDYYRGGVYYSGPTVSKKVSVADCSELLDYLSGLKLAYGSKMPVDASERESVTVTGSDGGDSAYVQITFRENWVNISGPGAENKGVYCVQDEVDWEYIRTLVE